MLKLGKYLVLFLCTGPGVKNKDLDQDEYRDILSLDMPVTVLNALGIEPGQFMRGKILEEIYEN